MVEEQEDENWAFRNWIKVKFGFDDGRLMSVVRDLADEFTARIDRTQCANCCRETATEVDEADMERLAVVLGMAVRPCVKPTWSLTQTTGDGSCCPPCPLLEGSLCRVYGACPQKCREYPHLHNDFRAASISRIRNAFLCPIGFNVVQEMKYALGWPRRTRRQ